MKIKVFGPGCARCMDAEKVIVEAVREAGVEASVEKVTDLKAMMIAGIMSTPAVSVNGKMMCIGRVPTKNEAREWLKASAIPGSTPTCSCGTW